MPPREKSQAAEAAAAEDETTKEFYKITLQAQIKSRREGACFCCARAHVHKI
jgi:hypothetical protein